MKTSMKFLKKRNSNNMIDKKILLYNFKTTGPYAPSWDTVPEDLGSKIVNEYFFQHANGIGFSGFTNEDDVKDLVVFKEMQPAFLGNGKAFGYDDSEEKDLAVYELTREVLRILGEFPYQEYSIAFEGYATDDLIFFYNFKEIGRITPHEGRIEFVFTTIFQKQELLNLDKRIRDNLHSEQELREVGV